MTTRTNQYILFCKYGIIKETVAREKLEVVPEFQRPPELRIDPAEIMQEYDTRKAGGLQDTRLSLEALVQRVAGKHPNTRTVDKHRLFIRKDILTAQNPTTPPAAADA
jgi:hypothetical protein